MYRYLVTVGLMCVVASVVRAADRVIAFPQNERYGYVVRHDSTQSPSKWTDIVRLPTHIGDDTALTVLRSAQPVNTPTMCSRDAVSFLEVAGDSAHLIVVAFSSPGNPDTIISCLSAQGYEAQFHGSMQFPSPLGLTAVWQSYFWQKDSLLFWKPIASERVGYLEIGRIEPGQRYERIDWLRGISMPIPSADLSELICRADYIFDEDDPLGLPGSKFLRYDPEGDAFIALDSVNVMCFSATRRSRQDSIWCIAFSEDSYDENLCRVVNGHLLPVTDLKYPEKVSAFRLYADSVVIDTITCCGNGVAH